MWFHSVKYVWTLTNLWDSFSSHGASRLWRRTLAALDFFFFLLLIWTFHLPWCKRKISQNTLFLLSHNEMLPIYFCSFEGPTPGLVPTCAWASAPPPPLTPTTEDAHFYLLKVLRASGSCQPLGHWSTLLLLSNSFIFNNELCKAALNSCGNPATFLARM